jgi:hypothetical protein
MCTKAEYDAWINGEMYYMEDPYMLSNTYNGHDFLTKEELINAIAKSTYSYNTPYTKEELEAMNAEEFEEAIEEYEVYTYGNYWDRYDYLEGFHSTYTTPAGEEVVAFGRYGFDG